MIPNEAPQNNPPLPTPERRKLPPMLEQYLEHKQAHPDAIVFFQVGDFYETFFEDALTVARVLNITLTSRDKNSPNPIPMAGVPIGVIDNYVGRLVSASYSVALVSQAEAARPGKMVARKLDRIITPGIRVLSNGEADAPMVASVFITSEQDAAICFSDVQSARLFVREGLPLSRVAGELSRVGATEVVLPQSALGKRVDRRAGWVREIEGIANPESLKFRNSREAGSASAGRRLESAIPGYTTLSPSGRGAARILLDYIDEVTVTATVDIREIAVKSYDDFTAIDARTRDNLELVRNSRDHSLHGTLLGYMNRTVTGSGARLLREWILGPLTNVGKIQERQQLVRILRSQRATRLELRELMKYLADLDRIATRLELRAIFPSEMGALRDSLTKIPQIVVLLSRIEATKLGRIVGWQEDLSVPEELATLLQRALSDTPPHSLAEGGVFRDGFDEALDRFRLLRTNGRGWIAELEGRERSRTGIGSLKVKFNNVIGYFIEITNANQSKVPVEYVRRQSTTQAGRYTTDELARLAEEVLGAESKQFERERALFLELRDRVLPFAHQIRSLAETVAEIDVVSSLAELAEAEDLVQPAVDDSNTIQITAGKHPVLAVLLGGSFIPNSLTMDQGAKRCLIVTGPNMGGKSTYLRQAALLVIMAQIGSSVPAEAASIGVVDKIFARLGASDDLTEGESTFMVEMKEASYIVTNATERSLLLIDEIGRGTATRDGLAIAQAILEWVVLKGRCRTLFATHFHELTELATVYPTVHNLSGGSIDRDEEVIFTHQIVDGPANQSYGIEVAKLAGLPATLIDRARKLLRSLLEREPQTSTQQMGLFAPVTSASFETAKPEVDPAEYKRLRALADELELLQIDSTTPLEALAVLSKLRARLVP